MTCEANNNYTKESLICSLSSFCIPLDSGTFFFTITDRCGEWLCIEMTGMIHLWILGVLFCLMNLVK